MPKELSKQTKEVQRIFECEDLRELSLRIRERLNNFDVYDEYVKTFPIHRASCKDTTDYLQRAYEEHQASKKGLGQCYTPACIADSLARITDPKGEAPFLDLCAGSGALTLGAWRKNPDSFFIAQEYDMTVIPYLLFNLAIRNVDALVIQSDALQTDLFTDPWNERYWLLQSGEKYSTILERKDMTREKMMDILGEMFEKITNEPTADNMKQAHILTELANSIEQMRVRDENERSCNQLMDIMASMPEKAKAEG